MGQMLCGDLQFTKGGHGNHLWAPLQLVSHDIFPSSSGDPVGRNTVFGNASSTWGPSGVECQSRILTSGTHERLLTHQQVLASSSSCSSWVTLPSDSVTTLSTPCPGSAHVCSPLPHFTWPANSPWSRHLDVNDALRAERHHLHQDLRRRSTVPHHRLQPQEVLRSVRRHRGGCGHHWPTDRQIQRLWLCTYPSLESKWFQRQGEKCSKISWLSLVRSTAQVFPWDCGSFFLYCCDPISMLFSDRWPWQTGPLLTERVKTPTPL